MTPMPTAQATARSARRGRVSAGHLAGVLAVAAALFLPWVALAWFFGPITGDLARIGGWSEREYGWQATQPALVVRGNREHLADPQVLVLGDSFSMGNVWQSVLAGRTGLPTLTLGYQGHGCIPEFIALAQSPQYASVRHVVVQTIERHLLDRFEQWAPCAPAGPVLYEGPPGTTAAQRPWAWPTIDWRYLWRSLQHSMALRRDPEAVVRGPEVANLPLVTESLFSSRWAARLLYYVGDDQKAHWTEARVARAAAQALELQRRVEASGRRFTLLVMPDKSSVYREHLRDPASVPPGFDWEPVFRAAGVSLLHPREAFVRAARTQQDVYLPDDTHLSPRGFELAGTLMAAQLQPASR